MLWTSAAARRPALLLLATISIGLIFVSFRHEQAPIHTGPAWNTSRGANPLTDPGEIYSLCERHGFKPFEPKSERPRKIYDLFLFSHELDWLEIRLNTMAPYVDHFVIVEAPTTFTGIQKPLYLKENWNGFTEFHSQIVHAIVNDPGPSIGTSTWIHEDFMRNSLFDSSFPTLVSTEKEAQEGDILLVSDVDEIPKPETLHILRHCTVPDRLTLRSHFYYYSFQWLHTGEQWPHPQATVFHGLSNTLTPNHLRNGIGGQSSWIPFWSAIRRWRQKADLWNAAWHCSSCFATLAEMRSKMSSFSHTPLNTPENRDEATMMERVRNGRDLFGRSNQRYSRVEKNQDVPQYVLEHHDKFRYLLDRDGEDAGFKDWRSTS